MDIGKSKAILDKKILKATYKEEDYQIQLQEFIHKLIIEREVRTKGPRSLYEIGFKKFYDTIKGIERDSYIEELMYELIHYRDNTFDCLVSNLLTERKEIIRYSILADFSGKNVKRTSLKYCLDNFKISEMYKDYRESKFKDLLDLEQFEESTLPLESVLYENYEEFIKLDKLDRDIYILNKDFLSGIIRNYIDKFEDRVDRLKKTIEEI